MPARAEHCAPELAESLRRGNLHAFQAGAILAVAHLGKARAWVERARAVTLRRPPRRSDAWTP